MDRLGNFPLFAGIDEEQLAPFEHRCTWKTYDAGALIIDHNEMSNDVRFIAHGTVRAVVRMIEGREVIFNDLTEGMFFGELAAIDDGPRSANVSALTNATICIVPQTVFRELCKTLPDVNEKVMAHMVRMIRMLSDRLSEFSFLKAKHRLYAELLRLSRERDNPEERIISPAPLQSDVADRISSRREIVSREMKELERQGILERTRGGLVIKDPARLGTMAAQGWIS